MHKLKGSVSVLLLYHGDPVSIKGSCVPNEYTLGVASYSSESFHSAKSEVATEVSIMTHLSTPILQWSALGLPANTRPMIKATDSYTLS